LYKIGWLRALSGKQALRKCGDEDDGDADALEDIHYGVNAGTTVRKLNICQYQLRLCFARHTDCLVTRSGNTDNGMAEMRNEILKIQRDDHFVFDDHHPR